MNSGSRNYVSKNVLQFDGNNWWANSKISFKNREWIPSCMCHYQILELPKKDLLGLLGHLRPLSKSLYINFWTTFFCSFWGETYRQNSKILKSEYSHLWCPQGTIIPYSSSKNRTHSHPAKNCSILMISWKTFWACF